jgi:hypothetical protein
MRCPAERARARADANAVGGDEVASAFSAARGASSLEAVLVDVERALLDRVAGDGRGQPQAPQGYLVGLAQLEATLAGAAAADAAGDAIALRGELVNLAAQSAEWAHRLR